MGKSRSKWGVEAVFDVWKRIVEFIFYSDVKLFILYREANQKAGKLLDIGRCPSGSVQR